MCLCCLFCVADEILVWIVSATTVWVSNNALSGGFGGRGGNTENVSASRQSLNTTPSNRDLSLEVRLKGYSYGTI